MQLTAWYFSLERNNSHLCDAIIRKYSQYKINGPSKLKFGEN